MSETEQANKISEEPGLVQLLKALLTMRNIGKGRARSKNWLSARKRG